MVLFMRLFKPCLLFYFVNMLHDLFIQRLEPQMDVVSKTRSEPGTGFRSFYRSPKPIQNTHIPRTRVIN